MSLMSRLSGFTCRNCGAPLRYLPLLSTADTMLAPARRVSSACPACSAGHRLEATHGRRALGLLPQLAVGLALFLAIRALVYGDGLTTTSRMIYILLGIMVFFPMIGAVAALENRLRYTVASDDPALDESKPGPAPRGSRP